MLDSTKLVGHIIQSIGAVDADYDATIKLLWRSFYANAGLQGNCRLPFRLKLQLLQRATLPYVDGHAVRWPYTKKRARQLDQVQLRMLTGLAQIKAGDYVSAEEFFKQRNSAVTGCRKTWEDGRYAGLPVWWHGSNTCAGSATTGVGRRSFLIFAVPTSWQHDAWNLAE